MHARHGGDIPDDWYTNEREGGATWLLVACCVLLVACRLLLVACCLLLVGCLLLVACCLLLVAASGVSMIAVFLDHGVSMITVSQ